MEPIEPRPLQSWEIDVVAEAKRRLSADPTDSVARVVLEDLPNRIAGQWGCLDWFLIHPPEEE